MRKELLIQTVNEFLKPHGFRKRGSSWYYTGDGLISVFNLQKSIYSNLYYVNIGLFVDKDKIAVSPLPENKGDVKFRLNTLADDELRSKIESTFDLESSIDDSLRRQQIDEILTQVVAPVFTNFLTLSDASRYLTDIRIDSIGVITLEGRRILQLEWTGRQQ